MHELKPERIDRGSRPTRRSKIVAEMNVQIQHGEGGFMKRRNGSEKVGECEISWGNRRNALRPYFF